MTATVTAEAPVRLGRRGQAPWLPQRALFTKAALEEPFGRSILDRVVALGVDVVELPGNRLTGLRGADERETYRRAKRTLAVVAAPPSTLKLQPIPPSADFSLPLAEGCPGHCQYCYLAGSLSGPPVVKVFANLPAILEASRAYEQPGRVTSFECSCYTDPLGIEHLTGSLAAAIEHVAGREGASLRWTTKYADVEPLLGLAHGGRTRCRVSLNAPEVARRFEGGVAPLPDRLTALRRLAAAGYPVGLTIAPIMAFDGWEDGYGALLDDVQAALAGVDGVDLTVELITHRFTPGSKEVQLGWYPATKLDLDEATRSVKRNRFGGTKFVYPKATMADLRGWFDAELARRLPEAEILYWT